MPYRRHSNLKVGQFSRTSVTGSGNVIKRAGGGGIVGPKGDKGDDGIDGVSPEPPIFTISAEDGDHSAAYISGSHPNWHITLVLKAGRDGIDGTNGTCNCTCECCNPQPPECPAGTYWNGSECVPDNTNCPEGYYWNGSECVPNDPPP